MEDTVETVDGYRVHEGEVEWKVEDKQGDDHYGTRHEDLEDLWDEDCLEYTGRRMGMETYRVVDPEESDENEAA